MAKQSSDHAQSSDAHASAAGQRKAHVRKEVDLTSIEAPSLMSGSASSKGKARARLCICLYMCICVCVCVYIYAYVYVCVYVCLYMHIIAWMYGCMDVWMYVRMDACMHIDTCMHTHTHTLVLHITLCGHIMQYPPNKHTHIHTAESVGGRFHSLAWSLNTSQAKALAPLASSRRAGDVYMSGKRDREGGDEAGGDHLKAPRRFNTVPLRDDQLVCVCVRVCVRVRVLYKYTHNWYP
jgi:hypothetical protein